MLSLLGRKTFRHGVHPPASKEATQGLPIRQFPFAPLLRIPLRKHIGKPAVPVVRAGQEVLRGEMLGRPDGFLSVPSTLPPRGGSGGSASCRASPAR